MTERPKTLNLNEQPGLFRCGEPPSEGEYVWRPDGKYMVVGELLVPVDEGFTKPSFGEQLATKLLCPACFLPRFIPGHRFRGCDWR